MLALVNTPHGPSPIELREIAEPTPANNEALVEVHAFSLNRGELSSFARNKEGWVPGQDVAGVVLRQAANGAGPPVGANVNGLANDSVGLSAPRSLSHRMAVLPKDVSFAQAATLPVAGLTALRTLRHGGALVGRRVLITLAQRVASARWRCRLRHWGAHVTAVVGSPERAAGLQGLGDEVVEGIDNVQGRFALVLNFSGGGASLATAIKLVEPNGTVVVYGASSNGPTTISFADSALPNARLQGSQLFYFGRGGGTSPCWCH